MTRDGVLSIGVVGAGRMGRRHVELISASPDCRLAGIADPVGAEDAAEVPGGAPWFDELDALLAVPGLDAVIVATPNTLHLEHGLACISTGIPTLVEKPIATSVKDGVLLADAAAKHGVAVLVGHHRRHSSFIAEARSVVERGIIGDVVAVSGTALFFKPDEYFADAPWRAEPGGGPILINLVHEIDDLRAICGDVLRVQAVTSRAVRGHAVEDSAALLLEFASGALGTFVISDAAASPWSWEQTSGEDAAYASYAPEDCYRISGTRGSLAVPSMRLWTTAGVPSWYRPMGLSLLDAAPADPLARQLAHFCDVVRGEAAPLVTAADAVETLRVTLAVVEAARSGTAVSCAPRT